MQNRENHIDEFFRDKLMDHEVVPPAGVWNDIASDLDGRKRRKKGIWIIAFTAAASLLFAFVAGWYFSGQNLTNGNLQADNAPAHQPMNIEASKAAATPKPSSITPALVAGSSSTEVSKPDMVSPKSKTIIEKSTIDKFNDTVAGNIFMRLLLSRKAYAERAQHLECQLIAMNDEGLTDADRAIIAMNMRQLSEKQAAEEKSGSGFSVGIQGSPTFRLENSSSMDMADAGGANSLGVSEAYESSANGGITVTYKTSSRLSIQSGINYDGISQSGGEIGLSFAGHDWQSEQSDFLGSVDSPTESTINTSNNIILSTDLGFANIEAPAGTELASANNSYKLASSTTKNYNLKQQAGYVEVPLIMRYRVVDQRLGFHLLGGINTNVLIVNNASLDDGGETIATGYIEGLNPVVFTSSVGVGVNYAFSERFNFSFEPTMKILLNSLSSQPGVDSKPYTMGVFTGLTYNF